MRIQLFVYRLMVVFLVRLVLGLSCHVLRHLSVFKTPVLGPALGDSSGLALASSHFGATVTVSFHFSIIIISLSDFLTRVQSGTGKYHLSRKFVMSRFQVSVFGKKQLMSELGRGKPGSRYI